MKYSAILALIGVTTQINLQQAMIEQPTDLAEEDLTADQDMNQLDGEALDEMNQDLAEEDDEDMGEEDQSLAEQEEGGEDQEDLAEEDEEGRRYATAPRLPLRYGVYRTPWQHNTGKALDISVGADNKLWKIGPKGGISRWLHNRWQKVPGAAVRLSVGPRGNPWVVNKGGGIFRWINSSNRWRRVPGRAIDIGVGPTG